MSRKFAEALSEMSEYRFRRAGREPEEGSDLQGEIKAQRVVALGDLSGHHELVKTL